MADLSGYAPGVASSVAAITQALASIQNMKFQRLLMLAEQARQDRMNQEERAFKIGVMGEEYKKAMDLESLRHENDTEEINLRGKYSESVARIREGNETQANGPAQLGGYIALGDRTKELLSNALGQGESFSMPAKDFAELYKTAAQFDKEQLAQKGIVNRENIITARNENDDKRALEYLREQHRMKIEGSGSQETAPKVEKQPTMSQAVQLAQNILQSLAYQRKDAVKALEAASELSGKERKSAEQKATDAISAIDKVKAEIDDAMLKRSYKRILDAVDRRRVQQGPPAPTSFVPNNMPLPRGITTMDSIKYGPAEQEPAEPQDWGQLLDMLKKQQGE